MTKSRQKIKSSKKTDDQINTEDRWSNQGRGQMIKWRQKLDDQIKTDDQMKPEDR